MTLPFLTESPLLYILFPFTLTLAFIYARLVLQSVHFSVLVSAH
jgi:hypothetical protein